MTPLNVRAALRRDRLVLIATLIGLIALSWAYQFYLASDMRMDMDMSLGMDAGTSPAGMDMSADTGMAAMDMSSDTSMAGMDMSSQDDASMASMDMSSDTDMAGMEMSSDADAGMAGMAMPAASEMAADASMDMSAASMTDMTMAMPMTFAWTATDFGVMFIMWAVMMAGMMLPSLTPTLLAFTEFCYNQQTGPSPLLRTVMFMGGYLLAWTAFSAVAVLAQWVLHNASLLSPMMVSTSAVLGGALFLVAGIFQWTPLKHTCLRKCRTPLGFFMTEWRDGIRGAFIMGVKNGQSCIGCCWLLMALLFVAGVMNLLWVAAIAAFVLLEKLVPRGEVVARVAGLIFFVFGVWMIGGALL